MKKLRLLVTKKCDRKCPGCCNKDWDLDGLEEATDDELLSYEEILITGGEPLLYPDEFAKLLARLDVFAYHVKKYVYTARTKSPGVFAAVITIVDGITVTLHKQKDVDDFNLCIDFLDNTHVDYKKKSLRLNIFKGIDYSSIDTTNWDVKDEMVWIKDCPLPTDEVFKKMIIK